MITCEAEILGESVVFDAYVVYQIIRKLATPFNRWDAYKLGIINDKGDILRKRDTLQTQKERNAFTIFDVFLLNLKKTVEKLPLGRTKLASFAAAMWLLKEQSNILASKDVPRREILEEKFGLFMSKLEKIHKIPIFEDGMTNTTQGIAGIKQGDVAPPRKKKKRKKKKEAEFGWFRELLGSDEK